MKKLLDLIKHHPVLIFFITFLCFFLPLFIVHMLFSWDLGFPWLAAKWSPGELIAYIAGFEAFAGAVALGLLALWQNYQFEDQRIEGLEPILSMRLTSIDHRLILIIENTGKTMASNIKIHVKKITDNGESELHLSKLFEHTFELYPNETVRGMVAFDGANLGTATFPQIELEVSYFRPDIKKKRIYNRIVIFDNRRTEERDSDTLIQIGDHIDTIMRAQVRIANYLDGCAVAPFDKLNIIARKNLKADLLDIVQGLETSSKSLVQPEVKNKEKEK